MATPEPAANPYAAPQSALVSDPPRGPRTALRWHLAWAVVFGVNLVVPLLFGWGMTRGTGRIGLVLGIAVMLALGYWLCARSAWVRFPLVAGGVGVGLSQFLPMLQVMAGVFANAILRTVVPSAPGAIRSGAEFQTGIEGFLITVLTGGQLMFAALGIGLALFAIKSAWSKRRRRSW